MDNLTEIVRTAQTLDETIWLCRPSRDGSFNELMISPKILVREFQFCVRLFVGEGESMRV